MYEKTSETQQRALAKIGDDEPIFILRARDEIAADAVAYWLREAGRRGVNSEKIEAGRAHLAAITEWGDTHGMKLPD